MNSLDPESVSLTGHPIQDTDLNQFKFVYKPLPTNSSIRLLHLQSGVGDGAVIRLSMRTVDLDENPQYDALSYTWSRPISVFQTKEERDNLEDRQLPVICDGQIVNIGRNLHDFLGAWQRMFQAASDDNDDRTVSARKAGLLPPTELWIDAICINQRDMDEKSTQVSMMGRIFSQTQKVIIWLGPEDNFTRPALQIIFKMQGIQQLQARACRSMTDEDGCKALGLPPITSSIWWSVFAFLHRSWFRRVWVMQELAFAPQIQMQCGLLTFPWAALSKAACVLYESRLGDTMDIWAWMELDGPKFNEPLFLEDLTPILTTEERLDSDRNLFSILNGRATGSSFHNIIRLEAARIGDGSRLGNEAYGFRLGTNSKEIIPSIPILHMFDSTRRSESSDPRDKIYAVLDIAKRDVHDTDLVSPYRRPLVPNYNLDTAEVYFDAAWYILLSGNDLELLSRKNLCSKNDDSGLKPLSLPSWVPDWTLALNETPMWALKPFKEGNWSASRNVFWVPPEKSSVYRQILTVQGALVDIVAEVVESESFSLSKSGVVAAGLPAVYPWASEKLTPGDVLWRTVIANYDEESYPASDEFKAVFYASWMEENRKAYREYYCEEGLSDPEKEAEWFRFVNNTFTIFPQEKELFEETSKTEIKGEKCQESVAPSPQPNNETLQQKPRQHDAQPAQNSVASEKLPIQIEQPSFNNTEPEYERQGRAEENCAVFSRLSIANQAPSQFDIMMKQLVKSVEFPQSGQAEANRADIKVEGKEKDDHQDINSDEDQATTQPPKIRSPHSFSEREFDRLRLIFSSSRRIFRTRENYLGNGPESIRPGDQVWILGGTKVPSVLRPQENGKHVLVGDSYVHGIMHGEAFERPGFEFVNIQLE
ncbi:Heterokaryon incompatibility protein (HET) domain containing protein [Hyaloscypha variabilis]